MSAAPAIGSAADREKAREFFNHLLRGGKAAFERAGVSVSLEDAPAGVALTLNIAPAAGSPVCGYACLFVEGWHPLAASVSTLAAADSELEGIHETLTEMLEIMSRTDVAKAKAIESWERAIEDARDSAEVTRAKLLQLTDPWTWSPIPAGAVFEVLSEFHQLRLAGHD